jgi:large subunit ribosomal protein L30
MLKITLTAGKVGKKDTQRKVLTALGLKKFGSTVVRADSPTIRGMVDKVHHLVCVAEVTEGTTGKVTRRAKTDMCQKKETTAKKAKAAK